MGIAEEEALPARFEALARETLRGAPSVEAWNPPLPGYNLPNEIAALELFDRINVILAPLISERHAADDPEGLQHLVTFAARSVTAALVRQTVRLPDIRPKILA